MKRKSILAAAAVFLLAACPAAKYGIGGTKAEASSGEGVLVESVAVLAGMDAGGIEQRFAGVVEPQKSVEVKTNGKKVKEVYVKEGDQVKAGDKLFEYDSADTEGKILMAQIELDRLKGDIKSTQSQIEALEKELPKLTNQDSILETTNRMKVLENQQKKNGYEIKKQELTVEQLKNSLEHSTAVSEIDGVVKKVDLSQMSAAEGISNYSPEEESGAFMTIVATGNYRIKSSADDKNKMSISEGLPATVHSRVDEKQTWEGTLGALDLGQGSEKSQSQSMPEGVGGENGSSYKFYVNLLSSEGLILGQHVYVTLGQENKREGIWLPGQYLVQTDGKEPYVWAEDGKGRIEKRTVTLGEKDEERDEYQILEGLNAKDSIALPTEGMEPGAVVEKQTEE